MHGETIKIVHMLIVLFFYPVWKKKKRNVYVYILYCEVLLEKALTNDVITGVVVASARLPHPYPSEAVTGFRSVQLNLLLVLLNIVK